MSERRTFEFEIDGVVTVQRLRNALDAWADTFATLQTKMGKDQVLANHISDLAGGSATAIAVVDFDSPDSADLYTKFYDQIGIASQYKDLSRLPPYVRKPASKLRRALASDIEDGVDGVVWRSPKSEQVLYALDKSKQIDVEHFEDLVPQAPQLSYGTVLGKLEGLNSHKGVEVRIYDILFNRGVKIRVNPDEREKLRPLWDKEVRATGIISRDPRIGQPLSIVELDDIQAIDPHGLDPWEWRKAAGVLRKLTKGQRSEEVIRKLWDEADIS